MHENSCYRDPERRCRKGPDKIFEDIISENFPIMEKSPKLRRQSHVQQKPKDECAKTHVNQIDKNKRQK